MSEQEKSFAQSFVDAAVGVDDRSGADKAAARAQAGEQTAHEKAAEAEVNESHEDRVKRLVAGYEHALEHNAPRTSAELAEIKALLGVPEDEDAA